MLCKTRLALTVADPKILKVGVAKDNVSAPSSFIANAHNELYMPVIVIVVVNVNL